MSLDTLLEQYRKREIKPDYPSSVATVDRAEIVFDLSVQNNISADEADAEVLAGELIDHNKKLEESPLYQDVDGLIDVFDPSEPPKAKEGVANPMGEILKAEIAAVREPAKWALKGMGWIFSPLNRGFKFATNALMYDPLTKSVAAPLRRVLLQNEIAWEKFRLKKEEAIKIREEKNLPLTGGEDFVLFDVLTPERQAEINQEVNERAVSVIRAEQQEVEKIPEIKAGDFLESARGALKSLVPWPGYADDVRRFGEISSDSYKRIAGRDAPWYYAPVSDMALETTALLGLLKMAHSASTAKDAASLAKGAKLTKAEIKAIKKLHKKASQARKIPVKAVGVPSADESLTVAQKFILLIKEATPLKDKKALLLHQDRVKKAAKLAHVQKNVRGKRLVLATQRALKGKAPVPDFTPINVRLTPAEIDTLFDMVNTSPLSVGFSKGNAVIALDKLLKGKLIVESEIANLEAVFGTALTKVLAKKTSKTLLSLTQDYAIEVVNLPRAVLASLDLSAAGRQGIIFSISHPIASTKAMGRSVRAALSLKYSGDIERATKVNRWGRLADRFGVHSSPTGFAAKISAKEEIYMSRIAENLPFGVGKLIAASERAFTTFLNQQRRETFATQARKWIRRGITPKNNPKAFKDYATFVNHATGRGSLEQLRPGFLTGLNAVFFAPRFQVSRIQVMGDLISPATTWTARKVIARDLAEFYATGLGIMGMAKAGGAEVEMDWRSSDFGKIKVGNTRYNYWGAFQPMARTAGQMFSGKIKQTGTGKLKDKERHKILLGFLRGKLAPFPGRVVDVAIGETFRGEPVEPTVEFATKAAYESLVFLFVQDSIDAWRFQGMDAQFPLSSTLAFTGIGVQTWELAPFSELELAKDSLARQTFGKDYDKLSFIEVQELDRDILVNHPGIVKLEQKVKFESNSVNFLTRQARSLRKSERFIEKRINKQLRKDMTEMQLRIGGVSRTFGNWRLDDDQYKEYQERVARNINELFEEMKPLWDTKDNDDPAKFEIMSRILSGAQTLAAQEMKIGDIE